MPTDSSPSRGWDDDSVETDRSVTTLAAADVVGTAETLAVGLRARLDTWDSNEPLRRQVYERVRHDQVALMPPRSSGERGEWHSATAEARDALAYALELAALEAMRHGTPTHSTVAVVHECHNLVESADAAARGLKHAPRFLHPRLHAVADELAPWASGPWRDPGPEDVVSLALLGLRGRWEPDLGLVVSDGDLDAAWRWGYLTAPFPDGRIKITRAPDLVSAAGASKGPGRRAVPGPAGPAENPYVAERAERRNRHGVPLDASLRSLVLPVELPLPEKDRARRWHRGDVHELFAPGQWAALVGEPSAGGGSGARRGSTAHAADIGFGAPELLVTRTVRVSGPDLRFGASEATLDDCSSDEEVRERVWLAEPMVCLSLWRVDGSAVMTLERLAPIEEPDLLTTQGRPDPQTAERLAQVDADVSSVLPDLLAGTGLDPQLSIAEAFPDQAEALELWLGEPGRLRRWFMTRLSRLAPGSRTRGSRSSILDLRVAGTERLRGRETTEGLYVVTSPRMSRRIEALLSRRAPRPEYTMATGAPRSWARLELVDEPAEEAAASAVRNDLRAVVLNLEAMSVHHEYRRFGGGMVALTIPFVAHRAAMARDYRRLDEAAGPIDDFEGDALATLAHVQRSALRRRVARRLVGPERFRTWTVPAQLVSALFRMTKKELRELDGEVEELAGLVRANLEQAQQQRRDRYDRVVSWVAPVAGFSVLVGMYAALASLPNRAHDQLLAAVPEAALVTGLIVVVGLVLGAAWDRAARGGRRRRGRG
ncbi:hypothetical protein [Actinotalea solisilvae]|uniref:hypothetical protein n=1 Tax=Actinotalea solisilvae TaxID=2072922 RepID=UPI0018F1CC1A|nr:hypothetical protein [Actinotalea solisilvae]